MQSFAFLVTFALARTLAVINSENDDCSLQQSTLHFEKVVTTHHGGSVVNVLCRAEATLNKCEGMCESCVTPSVATSQGFRRICRCCRDTGTRPAQIELNQCFYENELVPGMVETLDVTEITGCSCQQCLD